MKNCLLLLLLLCCGMFTTYSQAPVIPAPTPPCSPGDVISMFSETYVDVPVDTWRTVWSNADFMDVTVAGNPTKEYLNLDFVGIETVSNQIDASGMTHFHLDFWTPNMTEFRVKIVDFGPDCAFGGGDDTEHEIVLPNPAQNQWVSLAIPLSDFVNLTNTTKISQLIISGFPTGGGTVYIDNIYFSANCVQPMPSTAPPTPTCAAADVISMFSDTYADVLVDTWRTVWSNANFMDVTLAGNPVKEYTNLDFVGIETVTNQIDASGMTHFHLDFWTPNMTEFRVKLVDFGPDCAFGGGDDTEHEIVLPNPAQNQWVSLAIPLSDFVNLTNTTKISQLIISGFPTGGGTVYVDNIYFSTGCVQPMPSTAPPTPTCAAADVISMFSDAYADVLVDTWRTVWSNANFMDVTLAGNPVKEYTNLDFVGIETVSNQIDASGMTHFHLDFWTPNMTEFRVKIVDFGPDCAFGGGDDTEHEIVIPNPAQNQWVSLAIPLSAFTGLTNTTKISQFIISGFPTGGGTVYVDNVYFSTGCVSNTLPDVPAPTPTACAASNVISMFSDAYTDVPVDTWQTVWSSANFMDVTVLGDPVKEYTNLDFVGIETVTNQIDASGMTHFHLDFWTPNMTEFRVKLVDFGPDCAFGGGDDTEHEIVIPNPAQNQWVSLALPLSAFTGLTNTTKISQLIISGFPTGGGTVYIDNVYFSTACAIPAPLEAAVQPPVCDASGVISLFSDAYTDVPVDTWLTVWSNATFMDVMVASNPTKFYDNLDFAGIEMVANQIDATNMTHFHLDFWTPNMTEFRVKIVDFGPDCAFGGGDDTEHEIILTNPAQNQWVSMDIPLTDFVGLTNVTKISQIIISGLPAGGGTVYIDNVYFYGECNPLPACPQLVWADEFNGTALNTADWTAELGDGSTMGLIGWGNNELQSYEDDANNLEISGGTLKITAQQENVVFNGTPYNYTSARLTTANKQDFTYGRFEASIKLPVGQGIWPAFWLLHTNPVYGIWPQSGEIDIMEYLGQETDNVFGTIHYGDLVPNNRSSSMNWRDECGTFDDGFHEFALEWDVDEIRWYVDDYLFFTRTPADIAPDFWPYNQPFHIILNMAVGGNLPGAPNASTTFPQVMEVDYVRVYQGQFPYISGNSFVANQAAGEVYSIGNAPAGSSFTWNVPPGSTLVSGQGTDQIVVDWGTNPICSTISVTVDDGCNQSTIELNVKVDVRRAEVLDCVLENFDDAALITYMNSTGTLVDNTTNPAPDAINGSALVGEYTRDGGSQYDNLQYSTAAITDASLFVTGANTFFMDVYTGTAPIGSTILLQLESSATALPANYPTGRHSRYQAVTTTQGAWERLAFTYIDQPDASVPNNAVDRIVLLFNPNTFTGDTFYFDNFEKYCTDTIANCIGEIQSVPTMSEWGLFLFSLIMANLALVFLYQRKQIYQEG